MPHLWSGRFDEEPDPSVFQYGVSLHFDRQLFEDDVTGSLAWADAIARTGAISAEDAAAIAAGLAADWTYDRVAAAVGADPAVVPAALALGVAGLAGIAVYVALAAVLRVPELGVTVRLVRSGLGRGAR